MDVAATDQTAMVESLKAQTATLLRIVLNNQELRTMGEPELAIPITLLPGIQAQVVITTKKPPSIIISDSQRPNRREDEDRSAGH